MTSGDFNLKSILELAEARRTVFISESNLGHGVSGAAL